MKDQEGSVRAVDRALDMLTCFEAGVPELSLTEIAAKLALAPSTTSRILSTLEKREFVTRSQENQKYRLGPRISMLGALAGAHTNLRSVALPVMRKLKAAFNEGVSLYVVREDMRVCIERVESTQPLRRVVNVGDRFPLTRGAAGRLLLAHLPEERRAALLASDPYTTEEDLARLREANFEVSAGEREEGVTSIAAVVRNARGQVVATIAMSGPTLRFSGPDMNARIAEVRARTDEISWALGWPGNRNTKVSR